MAQQNTRIIAPVKIISVPNEDLIEPGFNELAQGTWAFTDFVDHRGRLLQGHFIMAGQRKADGKLFITVEKRSEWDAKRMIRDSGSLDIEGRTDFHVLADHPMAIKYLGETWCRQRAEDGTCFHGDCEFEA